MMTQNEFTIKGTKIQHRNGIKYEIVDFTNMSTQYPQKYPKTCIYKNVVTGELWSRPISDMNRSFRIIQ